MYKSYEEGRKEALKAEWDNPEYRWGEWGMFERITRAYYGKQTYGEMARNLAYSETSGGFMSFDEAYKEFIGVLQKENKP